jgi:hypothetical protein
MKKIYLIALGLCVIFTSCDLLTSLPSSTYLQTQGFVPKPVYRGSDTNLIRLSGSYSLMDIDFSEGTWTEDGDTVWSADYRGRGSWVEAANFELTYARALKKMSYGFGAFGSVGQFNEAFSQYGYKVTSYKTAGLGFKANFSLDVNKERYTMRAMQLQVGLSRDFGDYARNRLAIAESYPNFIAVPHLAPANVWMGNISISNVSQFYIDDFRIGFGGGLSFNGGLSDTLTGQINTLSGTFMLEAGYSNFDVFFQYTEGFAARPIASHLQAGVAYRFNF